MIVNARDNRSRQTMVVVVSLALSAGASPFRLPFHLCVNGWNFLGASFQISRAVAIANIESCQYGLIGLRGRFERNDLWFERLHAGL